MSNSKTPVSFIGLGAMGTPMVRNLLAAGFPVTVYNRSPARAHALAELGALIAETPAAAVQSAGTVITMVSNDDALEQVSTGPDGFLPILGKDGLHISMSTVLPDTVTRLAHRHAAHGSQLISAPVFGRPEAAAAAKLWICCSGPAAAQQRAAPLLNSLSQSVTDFGETPSAANVVKLSGNFLILSTIEALSEALALAEKNGINRRTLTDFFSTANFACPVYQSYGPILADRTYQPPGFRLELGMKDVRLMRAIAEDAQLPMPIADLLHARLLTALAKGRGGLDWSAIELSSAEDGGIKLDPDNCP